MRSLLVCLGLAAVSAIVGIRHRPQPADAARASRPLEIQSISLDGRSLPSLRDALSLHAGDLFDAAKAAHDRAALETALFHVRSVIVTGATETNAGVVTLAPGEVVAADRIAHARGVLAERLAVRGKPVSVVAKVYPDETAAVADVELAATP